MVSMKDIAQRCGVSVATVSKALNDQPDIGAETREKIHKVAAEMGYVTNSAARALKANRTFNIGILFVDEQNSGLAHEYFSSMLESLKVEVESRGYDVTFINRNVGQSRSYLQHCQYRGVDGVVIACVDFSDPQVLELVNSNLPVVTIDHVFNNRMSVVSDNVQGMEALVRFAYINGHRKLAYIHGERTAVTENRLTGFYRACEALGIRIDDTLVRGSRYHDAETCEKVTRELLSGPDRPTCIFFPDDYSYVGGLNAIREKGLRIPQDISVMGYDGVQLADIVSPRLTTYCQDTRAMGKAAARGIIDLIERPRTTLTDRIVVPGRVRIRDSVARLK